ncbi:MAG: flagellar biosynthetic protein FliR, partial [Magnetococcales bacterium]|nr:flagellar biosynthetic protein FliR [Magnetococcales bacterium]
MDPAALMDLFGLSIGEVERLVLIAARLSGLFASAPFFSRAVGPVRIRAAIMVMTTFTLFPLVSPWSGEGSGNTEAMWAAV